MIGYHWLYYFFTIVRICFFSRYDGNGDERWKLREDISRETREAGRGGEGEGKWCDWGRTGQWNWQEGCQRYWKEQRRGWGWEAWDEERGMGMEMGSVRWGWWWGALRAGGDGERGMGLVMGSVAWGWEWGLGVTKGMESMGWGCWWRA